MDALERTTGCDSGLRDVSQFPGRCVGASPGGGLHLPVWDPGEGRPWLPCRQKGYLQRLRHGHLLMGVISAFPPQALGDSPLRRRHFPESPTVFQKHFFPLCSLQEKGNAAAPQAGGAVAPRERPGSRRWISTLLSVKSHDHGSQFPPALDPGRGGCERAPGFAKRLSPLAADILVSHVGLRCIQRSGNRFAGEHPAPR